MRAAKRQQTSLPLSWRVCNIFLGSFSQRCSPSSDLLQAVPLAPFPLLCEDMDHIDLCPSMDSHFFISRYPSVFKTPQRTLASVLFVSFVQRSSILYFELHVFFVFRYIFLIFKFIFGHAGSLLLHGSFSSRVEWRLLSCCSAHTSGSGLSCCRAWALGSGLQQLWLPGSRAQAKWLWHTGLVAP